MKSFVVAFAILAVAAAGILPSNEYLPPVQTQTQGGLPPGYVNVAYVKFGTREQLGGQALSQQDEQVLTQQRLQYDQIVNPAPGQPGPAWVAHIKFGPKEQSQQYPAVPYQGQTQQNAEPAPAHILTPDGYKYKAPVDASRYRRYRF